MGKQGIFKLNELATRIIVAVFGLIIVMLGITATGIFDVSDYTIAVAKVGTVVVIFADIGFLSIVSKGKKGDLNIVTGIELVIGALVLIETAITLIGIDIGSLSNFSGWIVAILGFVFLVEAFVRK